MQEPKFEIGDSLRDRVTGLQGIAMAVAFYHSGCVHYALQVRKVKDVGGLPEWQWMDQNRLDLKKKKAVVFDEPEDGSGGPVPNPPAL